MLAKTDKPYVRPDLQYTLDYFKSVSTINETLVEEIDYIYRPETILVDGILLRKKITNQLMMDDYHYMLLSYCSRFNKRWADDDHARVPKYNTGRHLGIVISASLLKTMWYDERISCRGDLVIAVPHDILERDSTIYYKKEGKERTMLDFYSCDGTKVYFFLKKHWPVYKDKYGRNLVGLPREMFQLLKFT